MTEMIMIIPDVESANDNDFLISHWHVSSGSSVRVGDPLADIETSKSSVEILSEHEGILYYVLPVGSVVDRSSPIAVISHVELTEMELREALSVTSQQIAQATDAGSSHAPVFSDKAVSALQELGVPRDRFPTGSFVTEEMVLAESRTSETAGIAEIRVNSRVDGSALVIVGGGGHAATLLDLLRIARAFNVVGILDDQLPRGHVVNGVSVIGPTTELTSLVEQGCILAVNAVGGIGLRRARQDIWSKIKSSGMGLPCLVHPGAIVDSSATLGEGAQVMAGSYVGARSQVGQNVIVNTSSVVSHDCVIQDHAHIAPGALLAGNVSIGQRALIGMGATVHMQVQIGDDVVVPNGTRVTEDLANVSVDDGFHSQ